jgi:hypothetical protein
MKKNQIFILLLIVLSGQLFAQDSLSFQFPSYSNATIAYKNGSSTQEKINYNFAEQRLYFVDKKDNQIKVVSSTESIALIRMGDRKFLMDVDGLKEVVAEDPLIYVQMKAKTKAKAKTIGYGGSDGVASVTTYSEFKSGGQISILENDAYEVSSVYKIYWIVKNNKRKLITNFKQLQKMYPKNKEQISNYIETKNVNFDNVTQFVDLVKYAESL